MKRALTVLIIVLTCTTSIFSQNKDLRKYMDGDQLEKTNTTKDGKPLVVFSKFKLDWYSVMGMRGGGDGQRLKLAFKNKSNKSLKYVNVHYWAINAVNDITTDKFGRKEFRVDCTGPFTPENQTKLEVQIALFHPNLLRAYPYQVDITFMDGEEIEIEINKDNIKWVFPCLEYVNIGNME